MLIHDKRESLVSNCRIFNLAASKFMMLSDLNVQYTHRRSFQCFVCSKQLRSTGASSSCVWQPCTGGDMISDLSMWTPWALRMLPSGFSTSFTWQGPISHWQVSAVTQAFSWQAKPGTGLENIACNIVGMMTRRSFTEKDKLARRFSAVAQTLMTVSLWDSLGALLRSAYVLPRNLSRRIEGIGKFSFYISMLTVYSHPESWEQASREERTQDLLCCSLSLLRRSIHGVQLACEVYDGIIPA